MIKHKIDLLVMKEQPEDKIMPYGAMIIMRNILSTWVIPLPTSTE
jgi:hypothetical protein